MHALRTKGSPSTLLLAALRRAARPDRARIDAYLSLERRPCDWAAYAEFLTAHRRFVAALDRALVQAGTETRRPLPDGARPPSTEEEGADPLYLPSPRKAAHALGYLYVLESFGLGCAVLSRRIRGRSEPGGPAAGTEHGASRAFRELLAKLREVPAEDQLAVIEGAQEAFAAWQDRLSPLLQRLGLTSEEAHAA